MMNDGGANITSISVGCYFVDNTGNVVDQKNEDFTIELKSNYSHDNSGTFSLVFENVKGKPSTVEIYSVTGTFGLTQKEERKQWLDENWWIWLIVAYVVVGIVIGMLCGMYIGAEFGCLDEDFWLSLLCGLFWPIGGIVLLVNYIKEKNTDK